MIKKMLFQILSLFGLTIIKSKFFRELENKSKAFEEIDTKNLKFQNSLMHLKHFDYRGTILKVDDLSLDELITLRCSFNQLERTNVIFAVCSSLFRGDYFEFGCNELSSFLTTLNLVHVYDIQKTWDEKKMFYGFDIFGDLNIEEIKSKNRINKNLSYFKGFENDLTLSDYYKIIQNNGLYQDRCVLIKGLINSTFTNKFINEYLETGRKAGFVYIDLNIASSYVDVFKKLPKILRKDAFIYIDEYIEQPEVTALTENFRKILYESFDIGTIIVRDCGGYGALMRCYDKNILKN